MQETKEKLERILYLVPYVLEHQGIKLIELAKALGTEEKEVLNDIQDIFMSGDTEWQHMSIYVDKENKVFIENADFFTRPLSLTIPEAFGLTLAGDVFKEVRKMSGIEVLRSAVKKVYDAMPSVVRGKTKGLKKMISIAPARATNIKVMKIIEQASKEQKELRIEYYTYSRDDYSTRTLRPYGLINYGEYWYLAGFCLLRNEERIFRVDRIKSATKTKKKFDFPEGVTLDSIVKEKMCQYPLAGMKVKVRFDSEIARWFLEKVKQENIEKCKDGSIIATFYTDNYNWIIKWLLPHAEHAHVLEPKFLVDEMNNTVRRLLQIYNA